MINQLARQTLQTSSTNREQGVGFGRGWEKKKKKRNMFPLCPTLSPVLYKSIAKSYLHRPGQEIQFDEVIWEWGRRGGDIAILALYWTGDMSRQYWYKNRWLQPFREPQNEENPQRNETKTKFLQSGLCGSLPNRLLSAGRYTSRDRQEVSNTDTWPQI